MSNSLMRPLEGIRVLDLTVALSGPYATLNLAALGAEVIRVEAPGGSDISRTNPPFVGASGMNFGANTSNDLSLTTLNRSRNKKSITLDLKSKQGHAILMRLAAECDVLVENMSEGATSRLKVDYECIRKANPRIIYASIKAFGEPSAYPDLKGMDIIVQALSGVMEVNGFADGPPTRVGLPIADMLAPLFAVQGVLAALIQRGRTGEGQQVKVSMLDAVASWIAEEHFDVLVKENQPTRSGNYLDRLAPFGVYKTKDGYVSIVAVKPDWFKALAEAMGRPELAIDPRFATRGPRLHNASALNAAIEEWTQTVSTDVVVFELLEKRGVPSAKVRTPREVVNDPHILASGAVVRLQHPKYGDIGAMGTGVPIQFSGATVVLDQPAAELGTSNSDIYQGLLKMSQAEMEDLYSKNVI